MNNNFMQMFTAIAQSGNPLSMMESQFGNNPLFQRAKEMAKGKNPQEQMALLNNLCRQRGINLNQLKNMFGIH